jgi:hypothetical protein
MRALRFAVRSLLKTPFVTAVAVLSLALGIGANSAIFSIFDQILLRPLSGPAPHELVTLRLPGPMQGSDSCNQAGCGEGRIWSYPMFRDLEQKQDVLAGIAGYRSFGVSIALGDAPTTGDGVYVTGHYFRTLGLQPALGRLIVPDDNEPGKDNMVAVLGHRFWLDRFGGTPNAIGQVLRINGRSHTIVGVAPEGFEGTTAGTRPMLYVPMQSRLYLGNYKGLENRKDYWVYVMGRLKAGSTIAAAKAGLDRLIAPILADVDAPLQTMSDPTLARFKAKRIELDPGARGQSSMQAEARTPLIMLFAITGVVLLIACANIANLLIARGANRATERRAPRPWCLAAPARHATPRRVARPRRHGRISQYPHRDLDSQGDRVAPPAGCQHHSCVHVAAIGHRLCRGARDADGIPLRPLPGTSFNAERSHFDHSRGCGTDRWRPGRGAVPYGARHSAGRTLHGSPRLGRALP